MYFEPDEVEEYLKSHRGARVWTIVEGDNDTQWLEQEWHLVNRIAIMIEDPEWKERMELVDGVARILGNKSLSWLKKFLAYLSENREGGLLP